MNAIQIVLGILTLASFAYTVLAYPHKYGALSGRSRLFRTIGICLLDLLLLLVLMATFTDFTAGVARNIAPIRFFFYVASCFFLCFALVAVAALDALESYSSVRKERRSEIDLTLRAEISRALAESASQQKAKEIESTANGGAGGKPDGG